jgi:hypothetical protein
LDDDLPSGDVPYVPTFLKEDTEVLVSEDVYFIEDYYDGLLQNGPARPLIGRLPGRDKSCGWGNAHG